MSTPRVRQTAYGSPLPELAEARHASLYDRNSNIIHRRHIQALLEDLYRQLLRRDVYAEVTISFKIVGGMLKDDVYVGAVRQYRFPGEETHDSR